MKKTIFYDYFQNYTPQIICLKLTVSNPCTFMLNLVLQSKLKIILYIIDRIIEKDY